MADVTVTHITGSVVEGFDDAVQVPHVTESVVEGFDDRLQVVHITLAVVEGPWTLRRIQTMPETYRNPVKLTPQPPIE